MSGSEQHPDKQQTNKQTNPTSSIWPLLIPSHTHTHTHTQIIGQNIYLGPMKVKNRTHSTVYKRPLQCKTIYMYNDFMLQITIHIAELLGSWGRGNWRFLAVTVLHTHIMYTHTHTHTHTHLLYLLWHHKYFHCVPTHDSAMLPW